MNVTIKQQIVGRILTALEGVKDASNRIYTVRESNDYTALGTHRAELIVVIGTEAEQGRDQTGQVYQFDAHVKIYVPHPPPPHPRRDYRYEDIATQVITALETPGLLDGLGVIVAGAEEQTFLRSGLSKIAGPWIRIAVQYSRKRANPYETYDPAQAKKIETAVVAAQPQWMEIY
jgi:hypothetical protein